MSFILLVSCNMNAWSCVFYDKILYERLAHFQNVCKLFSQPEYIPSGSKCAKKMWRIKAELSLACSKYYHYNLKFTQEKKKVPMCLNLFFFFSYRQTVFSSINENWLKIFGIKKQNLSLIIIESPARVSEQKTDTIPNQMRLNWQVIKWWISMRLLI